MSDTPESRKAFEAYMKQVSGFDSSTPYIGERIRRAARDAWSARDAEIASLKEQLDAQIELSQQLAGERDALKARVEELERTPAERAIALYDQIQTLPPSSRQALFSRLAARALMALQPDNQKQ